MPTFRKKPIEIEAIKFTHMEPDGDKEPFPVFETDPTGWLTNAMEKDINDPEVVYWNSEGLFVRTLEGVHKASPGDYIVKGVKGELYPVKPDIFAESYDAV